MQGFIVRTPLFEKGEVNFDYLPRRAEESERFKKLGESMVTRAGLLKRGWLALLQFNFFNVSQFYM